MSAPAKLREPVSERMVLRRTPGAAERHPRRFVRRRRVISIVLAWGTPVLLFALWQWAAASHIIDTRFFPAPSRIWHAGINGVRDGVLTDAVGDSVKKLLVGYVIGVLGGVAIGVLLGLSWIARAALENTLIALYTLPKLALYPAFLLIFGLGSMPQIVLVGVTVFFIVVLATTADKPEGQPVLSITGGTDSAAFRSAGLVIRSLPADLRGQVTAVSASTLDDVTLTLADGKTVLWGSEDDSVTKALVLVALIRNSPKGQSFDVSAPSVPVVR